MRASRLLSILMLLQSRGRLSATALAAELEVTPRTILRDMDQLSAAGVPVWAERGREGGFQLRPGWSTALTGLTGGEAQALFLAGVPRAAAELGLGGAVASARLKMLAAVPAELRADAERARARLHVDPVEWYRDGDPPAHLQAVADAVWRQRQLDVAYESWNGLRERRLKPLGLVLKAGSWYLVALAEAGKSPRTYRLDRIRSLQRRAGFRYPAKFHLSAYWQASTRRFEADIHRGQALVRASPRGLWRLAELSVAVATAIARDSSPDAEDPGWKQVRIPIESIEHAARQMLGLGLEVQVLEPPELRAGMAALLEGLRPWYSTATA